MTNHQVLDIPIANRTVAGRALAHLLQDYRARTDTLVLALPRGGVPVAYEIAETLHAPLDLLLVRKLGVPGYAELAMGAIASGGVQVFNPQVLQLHQIDQACIDSVAAREYRELQRREQAYRGSRPAPKIAGQQVILVDDGIATGATMQAAVLAVRKQAPARILIAIPVAATDSLDALRPLVDEIVCPCRPEMLFAIGRWYQDFSQVSDEQVCTLLQRAWQREDQDRR